MKTSKLARKDCPYCEHSFQPKRKEQQYCCRDCAHADPKRMEKVKATITRTYGSYEKFQQRQLKRRVKTCLATYGVSNPYAADVVKQRIRETSISRYGVANPAQSAEVRRKISEGLRNSDFDRSAHGKRNYRKRVRSGKELAGCIDRQTRDATYLHKYGSLGKGYSNQELKENYGYTANDLKSLAEKRSNSLESFQERHGIAAGKRKWEQYKKSTSHSLGNCIRRHGKTKGLLVYNEFKFQLSTRQEVRRASKESLLIFLPVARFCLTLGLSKSDIYFGYGSSQEYWLSNGSTTYSYDFTIPKLGLIIEYNGEAWHPNPRMSETDWSSWRNPKTRADADTVYELDQSKKGFAQDRGFRVITIWSSSDKTLCIDKAKQLIERLAYERDIKHQPRRLRSDTSSRCDSQRTAACV